DDGVDDDNDGLIDLLDQGCSGVADISETSATADCDDGIDDDGDGRADFRLTGGDPGCTAPDDPGEHGTAPCDDGLDNDGDLLTDYQANGTGDPQCAGIDDPDAETIGLLACANGLDDDGDGEIDVADGGCLDLLD